MSTRVQLADGRVVTVESDDPQEAARAAHAFQVRNPISTQARAPAQAAPDQPQNAQETDALRRSRMGRAFVQGVTPMGALIEPLAALVGDPRQRDAAISGVVDTVRQIPGLNMGRLASDTGAAAQRMLNNLPQLPGQIATHLPEIIAGATVEPFNRNSAARDRETLAAVRGDEAGARRAAGEAANANIGMVTNTAGALLGPLARTPLQGAALAAALTAPTTLSGPGTLQERLPEALVNTGGAGVFGAAMPLLARSRPARAPSGAAVTPEDGIGAMHGQASEATPGSRLRDFETAGVRPTLAATVGGTPAGVTKTISENWLGGFRAREGLRRSIADTGERAQALARQIGDVQDPELAGEAVQAGVRRFAQNGDLPAPHAGDPARIPVNEWSFPAKAEALYNRVFDQLEADERAMTGHVDGPVVTAHNTVGAINALEGAIRGNESRDILGPNSFLRGMRQALSTDAGNGSLSFRDLRSWRTRLREMMTDTGLRGDTPSGALKQVYGALTRDINATAQNIGGQAAVDLPRIDRWYRRISNRIETALEPFNKAGGGMGGGRQAYRRIIALASKGPTQNTRQLEALASSLQPDEMRTVGATLLDEMGNPLAGKPGALEPGAFSAATFATNWARLSEAGKSVLFPPQLRRELEALARVADYQREVEAMANHSRTAVNTQNIATTGGLALAAQAHALPLAAAGIAGMNLTGEMLTNPHFVRWLTHFAQARANGLTVRRGLAELRRLAARDPALIPAYNRLTRAQGASERDQTVPAQ